MDVAEEWGDLQKVRSLSQQRTESMIASPWGCSASLGWGGEQGPAGSPPPAPGGVGG